MSPEFVCNMKEMQAAKSAPYWALPKPIQMRRHHHIRDKVKAGERERIPEMGMSAPQPHEDFRSGTLTSLISMSTFLLPFIPPTSLPGRNYCQTN